MKVIFPPKAAQQEEAKRFILENVNLIYLHPCQELTRINPTGPALIPVVISHSASRDFTDEPAAIPQANCAVVDKVSKSLSHLPVPHKGFSPDSESHTKKEKGYCFLKRIKNKTKRSFSAKITHSD